MRAGLGCWLGHGNLASNGRAAGGGVGLVGRRVESRCSDLDVCGGKVLYLLLVYTGGIVVSQPYYSEGS